MRQQRGMAGGGDRRFLFLVVLCLALLAGCSHPGPKPVVGRVGKEDITREEFKAQAAFLGLGSDPKVLSPQLRREVLETLVRQKLVLARARKLGIRLEPEVLAREESELMRGLSPDAFQRALAAQGIGYIQWRRVLARDLLVKKTLELMLGSQAGVTAEEVRRYYLAHRSKFHHPAQVLAQHAVLPTRKLAQTLVDRVRAGQDMGAAAAQLGYPLDEGGEPVWLEGGHMPPSLERKIFALKPGSLAGPLASDYGFHVVRVLKKRGAEQASLAQAAEEIQRRLTARKMERLAEKWIQKQRDQARVWFDPDFLKRG